MDQQAISSLAAGFSRTAPFSWRAPPPASMKHTASMKGEGCRLPARSSRNQACRHGGNPRQLVCRELLVRRPDDRPPAPPCCPSRAQSALKAFDSVLPGPAQRRASQQCPGAAAPGPPPPASPGLGACPCGQTGARWPASTSQPGLSAGTCLQGCGLARPAAQAAGTPAQGPTTLAPQLPTRLQDLVALTPDRQHQQLVHHLWQRSQLSLRSALHGPGNHGRQAVLGEREVAQRAQRAGDAVQRPVMLADAAGDASAKVGLLRQQGQHRRLG